MKTFEGEENLTLLTKKTKPNKNWFLGFVAGIIVTVICFYLLFNGKKNYSHQHVQQSNIVSNKDVECALSMDNYPKDAKLTLMKNNNWDLQYTEKVIIEYLKFMCVASKVDVVVPSIAIDEAWHTHILNTRDYMNFCLENYGTIIHHTPSPVNDELINQFDETKTTYEKMFGTVPSSDVWSSNALGKSCSGDKQQPDAVAECRSINKRNLVEEKSCSGAKQDVATAECKTRRI